MLIEQLLATEKLYRDTQLMMYCTRHQTELDGPETIVASYTTFLHLTLCLNAGFVASIADIPSLSSIPSI